MSSQRNVKYVHEELWREMEDRKEGVSLPLSCYDPGTKLVPDCLKGKLHGIQVVIRIV